MNHAIMDDDGDNFPALDIGDEPSHPLDGVYLDKFTYENAIGAIKAELKRDKTGYVLSFFKGSQHITDWGSKVPPWEDTTSRNKVVDKLMNKRILEGQSREWIRDQLDAFLYALSDRWERDPNLSWIVMAPAVKEILHSVRGVTIWPSKDRESSIFNVEFCIGVSDSGEDIRSMEFTPEQWITPYAKIFNKKHLCLFLKKSVTLNNAEWLELREKLADMAKVEEEEQFSYLDDILDELIDQIKRLNISTENEDIRDFMHYAVAEKRVEGWVIHVHNRFVRKVLETAGAPPKTYSMQISKLAEERGVRYRKSSTMRVGKGSGDIQRVWTFIADKIGITEDHIITPPVCEGGNQE